MRKRIVSSLLVVSLLLSLIPSTVFASNNKPSGGSTTHVGDGDGSNGTWTSSIYTWGDSKKGLRFSIVDNEGQTVTTRYDVVDVVWSSVPDGATVSYNNKFSTINDGAVINAKGRYLRLTADQITRYTGRQINQDNAKLLRWITEIEKGSDLAHTLPDLGKVFFCCGL